MAAGSASASPPHTPDHARPLAARRAATAIPRRDIAAATGAGVLFVGLGLETGWLAAAGLAVVAAARFAGWRAARRRAEQARAACGADVAVWVRESGEVVNAPDAVTPLRALHDAFAAWCGRHRVRPLSSRDLQFRLLDLGYRVTGRTDSGRKLIGGLRLTGPAPR